MFLGQRLNQPESLTWEYKEFCLKTNAYEYFDIDEIEKIVFTGKIMPEFNTIIQDNLRSYFLSYIPKYASAFSNCDSDKGVLHVGVDDYGEVTGIPYMGKLNIGMILPYLRESLERVRFLNGISQDSTTDIMKHIRVKLIKLDITHASNILHDTSSDILNDIMKEKAKQEQEYKQYLTSRDEWLYVFNQYCCSLNKVLNKKRSELIAFIANNQAIDATTKHHIIRQLSHNRAIYISLPLSETNKHNPNDIAYWVCKFKDFMVDKLLQQKPKPPIFNKITYSPIVLFTQLSTLRKLLILNNPKLNYYLIKITFNNVGNIEFYNEFKKSWMSMKRVTHPIYGPCCVKCVL